MLGRSSLFVYTLQTLFGVPNPAAAFGGSLPEYTSFMTRAKLCWVCCDIFQGKRRVCAAREPVTIALADPATQFGGLVRVGVKKAKASLGRGRTASLSILRETLATLVVAGHGCVLQFQQPAHAWTRSGWSGRRFFFIQTMDIGRSDGEGSDVKTFAR
jgi:hypothetical protein